MCSTQGWLVIAALLASSLTTGQEACPGGTQVGQNCGGESCVSICAYDESPQQAPAPPPRIVERWEVLDDRFGAWALDQQGIGAYGVSYGGRDPRGNMVPGSSREYMTQEQPVSGANEAPTSDVGLRPAWSPSSLAQPSRNLPLITDT